MESDRQYPEDSLSIEGLSLEKQFTVMGLLADVDNITNLTDAKRMLKEIIIHHNRHLETTTYLLRTCSNGRP